MQFESFYSMIHTSDPSVVMENMAPIGAFEKWLKTGQAAPVASYLSEQVLIKTLHPSYSLKLMSRKGEENSPQHL